MPGRSGVDYYQWCKAYGFHFGKTFQGIESLWRRDGEALGKILLSGKSPAQGTTYYFPPTMLDACLQTFGATLFSNTMRESEEKTYLPIGIERFQLKVSPITSL